MFIIPSYTFFFLVAATYLDREAPPHLRGSAQGIITFVAGGIGVLAGNTFSAEIVDLVHPDDQTLVFEMLQDCLDREKTPVHFVFRLIRKDKQVHWVENYASRIMHLGRVAVQIAYLDVTERMEAEQEIELLHSVLQDIEDSQSLDEAMIITLGRLH